MCGSSQCEMVPFVIERGAELRRRERVLRITRIVAERAAILVIADRAGQRVISDEVYFVESTLTEANVHAVVARTPARGFIANAAEHRHASGCERCVQRPEEPAWESSPAGGGDVVRINGDLGI